MAIVSAIYTCHVMADERVEILASIGFFKIILFPTPFYKDNCFINT